MDAPKRSPEEVFENARIFNEFDQRDQPQCNAGEPDELFDISIVGRLIHRLDQVIEEAVGFLGIPSPEEHLEVSQRAFIRVREPVDPNTRCCEEEQNVQFGEPVNIRERRDRVKHNECNVEQPNQVCKECIHIASEPGQYFKMKWSVRTVLWFATPRSTT